jgi:hypothetical protein
MEKGCLTKQTSQNVCFCHVNYKKFLITRSLHHILIYRTIKSEQEKSAKFANNLYFSQFKQNREILMLSIFDGGNDFALRFYMIFYFNPFCNFPPFLFLFDAENALRGIAIKQEIIII